jgi:hypothetical protein
MGDEGHHKGDQIAETRSRARRIEEILIRQKFGTRKQLPQFLDSVTATN